MLKAEVWPTRARHRALARRGEAVPGGRRRRFVPSMRQRIDIGRIYRRALRAVPDMIDGTAPRQTIPTICPITLDELLSEDWAAAEVERCRARRLMRRIPALASGGDADGAMTSPDIEAREN